jgi:hypothetical protein
MHSRNVNTSEGLSLASVASNGTSQRVVSNKVRQIDCKVVYFVRIVGCTSVEVVGDPLQTISISLNQVYSSRNSRTYLIAWGVNQVIVISSHCEPGLENLRRRLTLGILFRLVTHETEDEVMRCGRNQLRRDRAGEEVRVVVNGILETSVSVVGKNLEVDIPGFAVRAEIKLLEVVHL